MNSISSLWVLWSLLTISLHLKTHYANKWLCVVSSGACSLSLPGASIRLRCGQNDSQREAAAQKPPSRASRQNAGHAQVAAALWHPKLPSGTVLPPSPLIDKYMMISIRNMIGRVSWYMSGLIWLFALQDQLCSYAGNLNLKSNRLESVYLQICVFL